MGNLKEVRSPEGKLLYYIDDDFKKKPGRNNSKVKSKSKSNSEFPFVEMPPKTERGKNGKLMYPKWLNDIQRRAYVKAREEGKEWKEANYLGMCALVDAYNAKMEEDGDISKPPQDSNTNS